MFLAILFLFFSFFLGWAAVSFFVGKTISKFKLALVSYIFGLTISSYAVLLLALLCKNLQTAAYIFLAVSATLFVFYVFWNYKKIILNIKGFSFVNFWSYFKKIPFWDTAFLLVFIWFFLDLVLKTLVFKNGAFSVAVAGYGDIPFHMAQINYFAQSQTFGLENPIFSGFQLSYPFLINFLSAIFFVLSKNFIFSFHFPSISLVVAGIILLYCLMAEVLKKRISRICAFLIFFIGSGAGVLKVIKDPGLPKGNLVKLINYLSHLPYSITVFYDAKYPAQNNIWSDFLTMFLMHQRSFFFGFALGVLCLFFVMLALKTKERKIFYLSGISIGLLPLAHGHTFVALSLIIFSFFLAGIILKKYEVVLKYLWAGIILVAVSLPSLAMMFLANSKDSSGFLVFRFGWMAQPQYGSINFNPAWHWHFIEYFSYLWQNFGLILPLFVVAFLFLFFKRNITVEKKFLIYAFLLSAAFLWIFLNIIKFQPWDFDNNKFFGWFLLVAVFVIGMFFDEIKNHIFKFILCLAVFFIISAGLLDAFGRSSLANPTLYQIFGEDEIKTAEWIDKNIPEKERILTSATHLNLVDSLAGRPVFLGYEGWLWTHGINYSERDQAVRNMYAGNNTEETAQKYGIKYVLVGPSEKTDFNANESFFGQNFELVYSENKYNIYQLP